MVIVRLDDRLVHGQVIYDWLRFIEPAMVIVVTEDLDAVRRALLRAALQERYELTIASPQAAAVQLLGLQESINALVLVPDLPNLQALVENGYSAERLILGALSWQPGRAQVSNQVYLAPAEEQALNLLAAQGIQVVIQARYQDVPVHWHQRKTVSA